MWTHHCPPPHLPATHTDKNEECPNHSMQWRQKAQPSNTIYRWETQDQPQDGNNILKFTQTAGNRGEDSVQASVGPLHHAMVLEAPGTTTQFCVFPLSILQRRLTHVILCFVIRSVTQLCPTLWDILSLTTKLLEKVTMPSSQRIYWAPPGWAQNTHTHTHTHTHTYTHTHKAMSPTGTHTRSVLPSDITSPAEANVHHTHVKVKCI